MPSVVQTGAMVTLALYVVYFVGCWQEGLEPRGSATLRVLNGVLSVLMLAVLIAVAGGWT